jgi:ATP/maltotriose-dependent transcriptional regulator MalT
LNLSQISSVDGAGGWTGISVCLPSQLHCHVQVYRRLLSGFVGAAAVSAPARFGKSSLAIEFCSIYIRRRSLWLGLSPRDPGRFLEHARRSATVFPGLGQEARTLLRVCASSIGNALKDNGVLDELTLCLDPLHGADGAG